MSFDLWLTFVAASVALLLIPGPTVLPVLGYALSRGRAAALPSAAGVAINALLHALLADRLRSLVRRPGIIGGLTRGGGLALIGMGLFTTTLHRAI